MRRTPIVQLNFDFLFLCTKCKHETNKWLNQCPVCGNWHTFIDKHVQKESIPIIEGKGLATSINNLKSNPLPRIMTGFKSLDGALGGGIFPSAIVLLAGDPGVGKSTLLLQVCQYVAGQGFLVLYVTGEESEAQIKLSSQRIDVNHENIFMMFEPEIERIIAESIRLQVKLIIVDSIKMCYSKQNNYRLGSVTQIEKATGQLVNFGKKNNIPILIIGHIDKKKKIAGSELIQHLVDTVLQFRKIKGEGNKNSKENQILKDLRYIEVHKNRFGSIVGDWYLQMTAEGLKDYG